MTTKTLKSAIWLTLVASAVALAAPGGSPGGPGGGSGGGGGPPDGKGNKPSTEVSNSLSVPAIMAGTGSTFAINCPAGAFSTLVPPSKAPVSYPEECAPPKDEGGPICVAAGYYYVQRDAAWQAPCVTTTGAAIDVVGKWGDNLAGGSASLKVGSPIRVEFLLLDGQAAAVNQQGYFVIKLEPSELDRESDYGHLATGAATDGSAAIPYTVGDLLPDGSTFPAIVFDPTARLKIERLVDGVPASPAVYNGTASGEINATGKIVYGYNLRVQQAGTYLITYTFPRVTFVGACNAGSCVGSEATLEINVSGSGGGGGGKPPGAGEGE
jgi:hypothetical protein